MKLFCHTWRQQLLADLDQELGPEAQSRLGEHLRTCAECREHQRRLAEVRTATAPLRRQRAEAEIPAGLAAAVRQRVAEAAAEASADLSSRPELSTRPEPRRAVRPLYRVHRYATAFATVILMIALVVVYQSVIPALSARRNAPAFVVTPTSTMARESMKSQAMAGTAGAAVPGSAGAATDAGGLTLPAPNVPESDLSTKSVPAANGSGSESRSSGGVIDNATLASASVPVYRLYTCTLSDLNTLLVRLPGGFSLPPELLSAASVLRILTSPSDPAQPLRQAVILAGYPDADAGRMAELFRSKMPASGKSTIETIRPDSQSRLSAALGEPLFAQLLPGAKERQLTYILITIGG